MLHAVILALALGAVPAGKGLVEVYGFPDNDSCGYWMEQRRAAPHGSQAYQGWLLGFISGLNAFGPNTGDIAPMVKADSLTAWVDQYCAAHPLESISNAGFRLADELKRRANKH